MTPNHLHAGPAGVFLEQGFHVICDKPVTFSLKEALALQKIADKSTGIFALTHNYTGYPMVKQARQMIRHGELGALRKIVVEYPQGWLSTHLEASGQKQAAWRTDPAKSGIAGAMGDIGTHAENLAEYVTGLNISELCADISTFVPGRLLDDDGNVLLRFEGGAKGILHASQIAAGEENNLNIRVYGEKGGLEWRQMEPNTLELTNQETGSRIIRTGVGNLSKHAQAHTRQPAGHPEGYVETFANIYRNFAYALRARWGTEERAVAQGNLGGTQDDANGYDPEIHDFPGVEAGLRGMAFINTVVKSNASEEKWTKFEI